MAVKNAIISWILNFRGYMLLKYAVLNCELDLLLFPKGSTFPLPAVSQG